MAPNTDTGTPPGLATPAGASLQETDFNTADVLHGGGERGAPGPLPTHEARGSAPFPGHDQGAGEVAGGSAPKPASPAAGTSPRAVAPDLLRGALMALMALDHVAVALWIWEHGQAREAEMDSLPVRAWNRPLAYTIRTLTHLCAPGFTFLLGMGVVYFGRSRTRLGWPAARMARHFVLRAAVLTLITVFMGLAFSGGRIWFLNVVLFALAVDYVIAGVLWLVLDRAEAAVARALAARLGRPGEGESRPLLEREGDAPSDGAWARASSISWHLTNLILVILIGVTAWWNIWVSPTGGHCQVPADPSSNAADPGFPGFNADHPLREIWFKVVATERVISMFPPMAWLSFAIMGLLYGRLVQVRSLTPARLNRATLAAALALAALFAATRLFRFGNLSEDCLGMPEHLAHPGRNPYLASAPSFFYMIKYPPDVAFLAFTTSANLLLLAAFGTLPLAVAKRFTVLLAFGSSALFFYLVHQIFCMGVGKLIVRLFGHEVGEPDPFMGNPMAKVDSVWWFWFLWVLTIATLYPLCNWYSNFKKTKGPDSIWRFF